MDHRRGQQAIRVVHDIVGDFLSIVPLWLPIFAPPQIPVRVGDTRVHSNDCPCRLCCSFFWRANVKNTVSRVGVGVRMKVRRNTSTLLPCIDWLRSCSHFSPCQNTSGWRMTSTWSSHSHGRFTTANSQTSRVCEGLRCGDNL